MALSRFGPAPQLIDPQLALPGSDTATFTPATTHRVLGSNLLPPYPATADVLYLGMGCFWGAEKRFWSLPGIITTAVGYQGGVTKNPTYEQVCSGRTGHAENLVVVYDPKALSTYQVLKVFWENHDPTQGYRQGNDVGTQYRSTLYWSTPAQRELAERTREDYEQVLHAKGYDPITTEFGPAAEHPFWFAEPYHQQYLAANPNGYDCHAETGITLPPL